MFHYSSSTTDLPPSVASSLDAIFVLGGGVPQSPSDPPEFVKERCDAASTVYNLARQSHENNSKKLQALAERQSTGPAILCLSAGTAHLPQLIDPQSGLPVWESTASAAYLLKNNVSSEHLFVETTSYDTISNAFFARTNFADIVQWRRLLIVTSEFHMERTKAIFDWIFSTQSSTTTSTTPPYQLYYLSTPNTHLTPTEIRIRNQHEAKGAQNIREKLSKQYTTMQEVWGFLMKKHDFFNAEKLVQRGGGVSSSSVGDKSAEEVALLRASYGGGHAAQSFPHRSAQMTTATSMTLQEKYVGRGEYGSMAGAIALLTLAIMVVVKNRHFGYFVQRYKPRRT